MDKNIVKNIIIEKQESIPSYELTRRDIPFGSKTNHVLAGLRRQPFDKMIVALWRCQRSLMGRSKGPEEKPKGA